MATSASFPRVGDRFTTIDDWKIAVYQACLRHGMRLGTVQSMPQVFCHLRCPNVPPTSEKCTFTTSIKRPPYSAPGAALVVDTLIDQHTCAAQVRLSKKPTAKTFVEKRLAKLMPTVGGSGGRPATSNKSEPSTTTPTSIGRKRKMSLKAVGGDPRGGRRRKRKRVQGTTGGGANEHQGSTTGRESFVFAEATDVTKLDLSDDLAIPHHYFRFATSTALLFHLYAFASQSDFLFSKLVHSPDQKRFSLAGIAERSLGGKVLIEIVGKEGEDGKWGVSESSIRKFAVKKVRVRTKVEEVERRAKAPTPQVQPKIDIKGKGKERETPLDASLTNRDNPLFTPSTPGHHFPSTSKSATTPSLDSIAVVASTCRTNSTAARPTTPALMPPLRPPALVPSAAFPSPASTLPRSATSHLADQPPAAPSTTTKPSSPISGDLILSIPSTTPLSPSAPPFLTSLSPSLPSSSHSLLLTSLPLCGLKTLEDLFLLCSLEERGLKVLVETLGMRKEMGEGEARRLFEALRGVRKVAGRVE